MALQIVQAAVDPDVSIRELAEMAQRDPALAVRMLSVVNSPAFGLPNKVADIGRAGTMLGISGLRNLALSLALSQMVPMGKNGAQLLAISLRRGVAARLLAQAIGVTKSVDDYFTAGLLLESGLLATANDNADVAGRLALSPAMSRSVQERASGLVPHPERGALLAEEWNLGPDLADAIRRHHHPTPPDHELAHVAWLAERVAAVLEGGDVIATRLEAVRAAATLQIPESVIDDILRQLPGLVADAARGFDHDVGDQPDFEKLMSDAAAQLVELNQSFQEVIRRLERTLQEKDELAEALRQANEQLKQAAAMDGLTGLANHRTFQDSLRRDLSRAARSGTPLSLVMMDVDHFKSFNDNYGHPAGDAVLRAVSQLLRASVRTGDVPARYGGEEFALILPETDGPGALLVAERLRANLEALCIKLRGKKVVVTASFGVSTITEVTRKTRAEELVAVADKNLYASKHAGRNRVSHSTLDAAASAA